MSFNRDEVKALASRIVTAISNSASNKAEENAERLTDSFMDFYVHGQGTVVKTIKSFAKPLLGNPCIQCRSYYDATLGICPVCKTPRPITT